MARNAWLVPITAIRRRPGVRQDEHRQGPVDELLVAGSVIPAGTEAEADVVLDVIVGGIEVWGTVEAPWRGECRRCLRPVEGRLHTDVRELYRPRKGAADDEDEETYPLTGEQLDLAPLVRDALLLALPLAPLCRPDCAGLCPTCGAELAEGLCACDTAPADPRWAALDALRPRGQG
jgi:uncharacterized protein